MSSIDYAAVGLNLGLTAVAVVALMALTLAVSLRRGRHDTIDTTWGLGFPLIAVVSFVLASAQSTGDSVTRIVVTALTVVWGVRLAVFLYVRNAGKEEDPRYQRILAKATGSPTVHMIRTVYLPQGVIMWLVSLPVQLAQYGGGLGVAGYLGIAVWLLGFAFEAIGDAQLARFRNDPASSGRVLDTGLWRYTRHPNYFGDTCVWWGLYLLAVTTWFGVATIVAPIIMTFLLTKGTGKPLLEKGMARTRPGYAEYVTRTSGFFPMPPKKNVPAQQ